jgi:predicted signal transduction protein with EAL and GGDEF domain
VEALMNKVDVAMNHAKEAGHDSYHFFESEMNARAIESQSVEDGLHQAIERQQWVLHYQLTLVCIAINVSSLELAWNSCRSTAVPGGRGTFSAGLCPLKSLSDYWNAVPMPKQSREKIM